MKTQSSDAQQRIKPILLTPDEANTKQAKLLAIDVQNPKFMIHMIPGGQRLNIDVSLKDIPKNQPVLITCLNGQRSFTAAQKLIQQGYCQVYVLKGGLMAWQGAGYPLELTKLPA
ncbi:MAG: rhodanese-like domain-containing protein [Hydrococcus sp. Prado102]|jgi:rhodanese-related sulfurtransferase|nr:rhodanese-like domain-containing protein [Hydrococcus sp. Prado102]